MGSLPIDGDRVNYTRRSLTIMEGEYKKDLDIENQNILVFKQLDQDIQTSHHLKCH
jgi:hypothetical protein